MYIFLHLFIFIALAHRTVHLLADRNSKNLRSEMSN